MRIELTPLYGIANKLTYGQVAIALAGWAFLFYLHNRTLRRSEISRLKDRLVDKVENTYEWLVKELEDESCDRLVLESNLSAKVTQVELRVRQLNHYVRCEIVTTENLAILRNIDVAQSNKQYLINIANEAIADTIESIESSYDSHYFEQSYLTRVWKSRKEDLFGAALALAVICLIFGTISLVF